MHQNAGIGSPRIVHLAALNPFTENGARAQRIQMPVLASEKMHDPEQDGARVGARRRSFAGPPSGLESFDVPSSGSGEAVVQIPRPTCAVVDPGGPTHPEFHGIGDEREPTPLRWARNPTQCLPAQFDAEPVGLPVDLGHQLLARTDRLALRARPGSNLCIDRAGGEVRIAVGIWRPLDAALDSRGTIVRPPVEHDRRARIRSDRASLATLPIGVHHERPTLNVDGIAQDHSRRRSTVWIDRGKTHRVGIPLEPAIERFIEPGLQSRNRVGRKRIAAQPCIRKVVEHWADASKSTSPPFGFQSR